MNRAVSAEEGGFTKCRLSKYSIPRSIISRPCGLVDSLTLSLALSVCTLSNGNTATNCLPWLIVCIEQGTSLRQLNAESVVSGTQNASDVLAGLFLHIASPE